VASFKHLFLTEMTPSIVITDPIPLWKVWVRGFLKLCLVVALCVASFYAGRYYQPSVTEGRLASSTELEVDGVPQQPVTVPASPLAQEVSVNNPIQADGTQPLTDILASHSVEGLQIQNLQIKRDPADSTQLLYSYELVNGGRVFDGRSEFLVMGMKDGHPEQRVVTPAAGADRLRVARYLKQEGKLKMPDGLQQIQAVMLSLHEPEGVRASRGAELK
jgi:hypothetical protein